MSDIVVLEEEQPRKRSKVPGSVRAGTPNKYTREMKEAMFAGAENGVAGNLSVPCKGVPRRGALQFR